jgi:hypothetical protein
MVDERGYFYLGGLFSLAIYGLTIFMVFSYMISSSENIKHFRTQKENILEINIVTEPKKEPIKQPIVKTKKPVVEPKKEVKKPQPPKKETPKAVPKQNIQDLFGQIKTKKPIVQEQKRVPKVQKLQIEHESVEKKSVASKMVEDLDIKKPQIAISSSVGEYNEYYGKISEILNERWHNTYSTAPGVSAWVDIVIDPYGGFDYKITKPSYNDAFNAMLLDFLESMRGEKFPAPKSAKTVKLNVEFKETF